MCGIVGIYLKTKKFEKSLGKMKYLGSTILKKTLNELDKSIHNET